MTEKQFREHIRTLSVKAAEARTTESRIAGGKKSWRTRRENALAEKPISRYHSGTA
jgi:hypothetical protein